MNINQTLRFIFPLIANRSPMFYFRKEFIGCFISDNNRPLLDGKLLVAYEYPLTVEFSIFEDKLMETKGYVGNYEYYKNDDTLVTIYIFSLSDHKGDIEKILEGKYSQLSPEAKLKITKFWKTYSNSHIVVKIFNKPNEMKFYWDKREIEPKDYCAPGEMWYIPDIMDETFNL